jgi:hypothetical protein
MAMWDVSNNNFIYRLEVNETAVSVANNTSTVSVKLTLLRTTGYAWGNCVYSTNVGGNTTSGEADYTNVSTTSPLVLVNKSYTIAHNADGTKTISCSGFIDTGQGSGSPGGNLTLTAIPRGASTPVPDASYYRVGDTVWVDITSASSSFTHDIYFYVNGSYVKSASGKSYVRWAPTSSDISTVYSKMPNTNSTTLKIECDTYSGDTYIGTKSVNVTLQAVVADILPKFNSFSYKDSNSAMVAITGDDQILVQGLSTLQVTISAAQKMETKQSATPKSYSFQIGATSASANYSTADIVQSLGAPTGAGTQRLMVTAFDSRSNSTGAYQDLTVVPYGAPVINASVKRLGGFDDQTTLAIAGTFSLVQVGGVTKNTVSTSTGVSYRYKRSDKTTWDPDWTSPTATVSGANVTVADLLIGLDKEYMWNFEVRITDKFGSTVAAMTLDRGQPILHIGKNKTVGINKVAEWGDLDVQGDIYSNKSKVLTSTSIPGVGALYFSAVSDNPNTIYPGTTWVRVSQGRYIVGVDENDSDFSTAEKTGGAKMVTLTTAQMPSHLHGLTSLGSTVLMNAGSNYGTYIGSGSKNTTETGGGGSHTNLSPYTAYYCWKRTV